MCVWPITAPGLPAASSWIVTQPGPTESACATVTTVERLDRLCALAVIEGCAWASVLTVKDFSTIPMPPPDSMTGMSPPGNSKTPTCPSSSWSTA